MGIISPEMWSVYLVTEPLGNMVEGSCSAVCSAFYVFFGCFSFWHWVGSEDSWTICNYI